MKSIAVILSLLVSVSAFAAEGDTVIEGKSDYICTINGENPSEENTFDQTLFSGEVLTDGADSQVMFFDLKSKSQIEVKNLENATPDQIKKLDGAIIFSVFLTSSVEKDKNRHLQLSLGRMDMSNPENASVPVAVGSGYYKNTVMVIDQINKVNASCFHKSVIGL